MLMKYTGQFFVKKITANHKYPIIGEGGSDGDMDGGL